MKELKRLSPEEFRLAEKLPVTVVLDNIRSQNNTGSVFRTSDAFRIGKICLCGITATPPHREIHKTALGAEESVEWKYYKSTLEAILELKNSGYMILALEQTNTGIPIQKYKLPENPKLAVVFGNEITGIGEEILALADTCLEIPQFGTKHSINVSVAVGITLWEIVKKMKNL
jgi:tRNA G18 (ribose-2'-O)-methylase SpoU